MESASPWEQLKRALAEGDLATARALTEGLSQSTQLAAEVLHELKQPLLGIKAYAQMLGEAEPGAPSKKPVGVLLQQVDRMEQIIGDFTRLASSKPAPKDRINLAHHIRQAAAFFGFLPESARISLEIDAPTEVEIQGNSRLLEQLTLNLLNNARDAMNGLGRIKMRLAREASAVSLSVADWGPGIAPEVRERIFDPYVTNKSRGSGLGLAVCRKIAQEHGAQIGLSPPGAFGESPPPATVFRVLFPVSESPANGRKRLLVVDDEEIIRQVFRDLMGKECEVVEAETAEDALAQLERTTFELIVTDKNLPGLSGLDLAQEARKRNPDSRVILMTGYPSVVTAQQAIELGVLDYLLKPFDEIKDVRQKLRAALAAPHPTDARKAPATRRVDVYEDNPATAKQISEALSMLALEANILAEPKPFGDAPPIGVIVSWSFGPASGKKSVELGKATARGAPFVVLAENLTMETALESLRGGAVACLPKLLADTKAMAREIERALKVNGPEKPKA